MSAIVRTSFDATISALNAETSALGAATSLPAISGNVTGNIGGEFTAILAIAELV